MNLNAYGPPRRGIVKIIRIMKLVTIMLIGTFLQVSAKTNAQQVTLSEKNAPLEKVFILIKKQTGYVFWYDKNLLKDNPTVTIDVRAASLEDALQLCFKDQLLTYTIVNKTIVVKKKPKQMPEVMYTLPGIDVHGTVVDENGKPVAGASVQVKGDKTKGTSTNENGYFELTGIDENATLIISGVNIESFEVKVSGRTDFGEIKVVSKLQREETITIEPNTGYQYIPKDRATGSFDFVDNKLLNTKISTDIITRLNGNASGVLFSRNVSRNGFNVRGRSTIFANTAPLVVLDNFPYEGDLNNINPNDVESITVLKDAAASSIWGVRAGNGVVVITTKRGKLNQPLRVELNTNVTVSQKPDVYYDRNFLKATDFIEVEEFLFGKGFYNAELNNVRTRPPVSPVVWILYQQQSGLISQQEADQQISALKSIDVRDDLSKYWYRSAVNQQYALNMSGGSDKIIYYFSAGYDKNLNSMVGNGYNRFTLNSSNTFRPVKNLRLQANLFYTQSLTQNNNNRLQITTGGSSSKTIYPYARLADDEGNALPIVKDYNLNYVDGAEQFGFLDWHYNPLNDLRLSDNRTNQYDANINLGADYTLFKNLNVAVKYQYAKGITQTRNLSPEETYLARNLINRFSILTDGSVTGYNIPPGGILDQGYNNLTSNSFRGQLSYDNSWHKHQVVAIAGYEVREVIADANTDRLYGYNDNNGTFQPVNYLTTFGLNPSGSGLIQSNQSISGKYNFFRSIYGNAAYTLNNLYTFSLSGRIDQSNLFGVNTNQKTSPLWSAGIKWDISREKFYSFPVLPNLNFRLTYGFNGNLDNTVSAFTVAAYQGTNLLTGTKYAAIRTPGNPGLKWEKTGMLNAAIEFGFKNNIITGSVEYYYKKGTDLIGDAPLPANTGLRDMRGNFSDMAGEGVDVTLNSTNINRTFKWYSTLLLSRSTDKVTKYSGNPGGLYALIPGKPVEGVYSFKWGGLDPETGDPMGYIADTLSKDYSVLVNQPVKDRIYNGAQRPTLYGTLRNTFEYKRFSFTIGINYKAGYYFSRGGISYTSLFSGWRGNQEYSQRWQKKGDEEHTNVPSMIYPANGSRDSYYTNSSIMIERGDHIRLQDIYLSYDLVKENNNHLPFQHLEVYSYFNNIGLIWKANKYGLDPDSSGDYPTPFSSALGLKVIF